MRGGFISDSVECYDPVTDCWTDMRPLPKARADHAACVAQGRLFVSGGVSETRKKHHTDNFWYNQMPLCVPLQGSEPEHRGVCLKGIGCSLIAV